jgi:hypothetical protein
MGLTRECGQPGLARMLTSLTRPVVEAWNGIDRVA